LEVRRWSEPVDLCLLLSQTTYYESLAPVEAHVDSGTHDVVSECGAVSQFQMDLNEHIRGRNIGCRRDKVLSRLIYVYYYPKQRIMGH
jgi:hypothetical protein